MKPLTPSDINNLKLRGPGGLGPQDGKSRVFLFSMIEESVSYKILFSELKIIVSSRSYLIFKFQICKLLQYLPAQTLHLHFHF